MIFFMTSANSFQPVNIGTRTSILDEAGILNSFLQHVLPEINLCEENLIEYNKLWNVIFVIKTPGQRCWIHVGVLVANIEQI